jgi:hypothetical protein
VHAEAGTEVNGRADDLGMEHVVPAEITHHAKSSARIQRFRFGNEELASIETASFFVAQRGVSCSGKILDGRNSMNCLKRIFLRSIFFAAAIFLASGLPNARRTAAAPSGFTLEQVMSSPFPDELVTARNGERVAWMFDIRGVRNLWIADGPEFAAQ